MKIDFAQNHPPKKLEIIIPFRWTNKRTDLYERIKFSFLDSLLPDCVGVTVSDDGSPLEVKEYMERVCRENGINYVYTYSEYSPVCMSRARNNAVTHVESDFILFQDADLIPYKGFYRDVLIEIEAQRITQDSANFLMFGVVYLTKEATQAFFETPEDYRKNVYFNYFLEDDSSVVEKFSTGTSVTLFHRHYYLSRGGYDEDFVEWGYEDLEFNLRCIRALKKFPLPENFMKDIGTFRNIDRYEGWKSIYRLFGDLTFNKGMVMFHAWHEIDNDSSYMKKKAVNGELFVKKIKGFLSHGAEPQPLAMMERGRTLCFSATNPFIFNRKTAPFFGEVLVANELELDASSIKSYVRENNVSRILFHNPYANEHRLKIFNAVKKYKIPFLISERGALRDSVFFDDTGFNADSTRYDYRYWSKDLTERQYAHVKSYILHEKSIDASLEDQPARIGVDALRRKLGIQRSKKVVFVPLQRPSDTVIKFFTQQIGGYDNFLQVIREAAERLKNEYVFVLKRHPLELETPKVDGVIYADETNVKDLLELASTVYILNSGVGVLALMYGKQVIIGGEAFYESDKLVSKACTSDELIASIRKGDTASEDDKIKFIHYLISEFYSFGHFETRKIPWEGGGNMTITSKIDFYQIRIPALAESNYLRSRELFKRSSVIFDRYRAPPPVAKPAVPAPAPAAQGEKFTKPAQAPQKAGTGNALIVVDAKPEQINKEAGSTKKKLKKLKDNPRRFFQDSNSMVVRKIGSLMGYRNE
ncbi:glycosyltransferase [Ottowia sp. VDI28]|uniref:capsular polysaccharide export protein, LipB/KpsS family n=1 Tax=Ottowia sp. VDI28 TaxID=3133968 RepID=UPI003C2C0626